MPDIATVTLNPSLDKSADVEHVRPNQKLSASSPAHDPGGGGINVARVAGRLGADVLAVWTKGGHTGERLAELLDEEGVPQRPVELAATTRENVTVYETTSGDQYRFGMPGAEVAGDEWQSCLRTIREIEPGPAYLVLSGSVPPGCPDDAYAQVLRDVPSGWRVIVDCKGPALRAAVAARPFLVKPNVRELEDLVKFEIDSDENVERAAREVIDEHGLEAMAVSLGSGGAALITPGERVDVRAPTVKVRSRVGAGDSMVGGLVAGLVRGMALADAVRFGVAAGAATVTSEGTQLCQRDDVERLYERMPSEG